VSTASNAEGQPILSDTSFGKQELPESAIAAIVEQRHGLGRAVYRGSWNGTPVVLKLIPPARSWRNRLSRKIVSLYATLFF